jgi:hypothetical protein
VEKTCFLDWWLRSNLRAYPFAHSKLHLNVIFFLLELMECVNTGAKRSNGTYWFA